MKGAGASYEGERSGGSPKSGVPGWTRPLSSAAAEAGLLRTGANAGAQKSGVQRGNLGADLASGAPSTKPAQERDTAKYRQGGDSALPKR